MLNSSSSTADLLSELLLEYGQGANIYIHTYA